MTRPDGGGRSAAGPGPARPGPARATRPPGLDLPAEYATTRIPRRPPRQNTAKTGSPTPRRKASSPCTCTAPASPWSQRSCSTGSMLVAAGCHVRHPAPPQAPDQHGERPGAPGLGAHRHSRPSIRPTRYPSAYRCSATPRPPCTTRRSGRCGGTTALRRRRLPRLPTTCSRTTRPASWQRSMHDLATDAVGRPRRRGRGPRSPDRREGGRTADQDRASTTATATRASTTRSRLRSASGSPSRRPPTCSVPGSASIDPLIVHKLVARRRPGQADQRRLHHRLQRGADARLRNVHDAQPGADRHVAILQCQRGHDGRRCPGPLPRDRP